MKKIIILLLCVFLTSCNEKNKVNVPTLEPTETSQTIEPQKNSLTIAISPTFDTLDPALFESVESRVVLNDLYEGLYTYDKTGNLIPGCAEKYEVSADNLTYTFFLKDGLKWSDGSNLTAYDFENSIKNNLTKEKNAKMANLLYYIENAEQVNLGEVDATEANVTAIDDKTLQITLLAPCSYFIKLTTLPVYYPTKGELTNGLFKVRENKHLEEIALVKNQNYNSENSAPNEIKYVFLSNEEKINAFSNKQVDIALDIKENDISKYNSDSIKSFKMDASYFMDINLNKTETDKIDINATQTLQNEKVRQAISLAVDRKKILEGIKSLNPNTSFVPFVYSQQNTPKTEFNLEKAKSLLKEAGYENGSNFPVLSYQYEKDDELHKLVAERLKEMLKQNLNIDLNLVEKSKQEIAETKSNYQYLTARHGYLALYDDPSVFLNIWLSNSLSNILYYKNSEYDNLLINAQNETDSDKRNELLDEAETILLRDMPIVPLFSYNYVYASNVGDTVQLNKCFKTYYYNMLNN